MIVTEARLACQDLVPFYDAATDNNVGAADAIRVAVAACQGCPVMDACLAHGISTRSWGVFGGRMLEPRRYKQGGVCSRGHDITGPNGRMKADGHRVCRICDAERNRARNRP